MKHPLKEEIIKYFSPANTFTTADVLNYYRSVEPRVNKATVNWRIYEHIQDGVFRRVSRGVYTIENKPLFKPTFSPKAKKLAKSIRDKFPLISFCVWQTALLKEFYHNYPLLERTIVEVETDSVEAVYYHLQESNKDVLREPFISSVEDFLGNIKDATVVLSLTSESPLEIIDGIPAPSLEKVLVDILSEPVLFSHLQGNELLSLFRLAMDKYSINLKKLLRYAGRRGKKEETSKLLNQINGNT